jgi:putative peptidoglycan lipid II flippase
MELPQGLFGISLATFLLPTLSGLVAEKKFTEFQSTLKQGLSYLSFSNLIAAAVSLALAEPIVRLLFEHGKFGPGATDRVALALMCLAPGLLLFSMNNILARAFFALNDIKTPMKISVFCLALNLIFAIYLVQQYREAGLAVANTISAIFNTGLLFFALRRKLKRLEMQGLIGNVMALIGIATVAGGVAFFVFRYWNQTIGHDGLYARLGAVFVPGALAGVTYWLLALAAKVPAAIEVTSLVRRKLGK